ncbi:MAG: signal recognition particle-docking protein FtsY [Nitriliruptoraceae bacterium]
MDIQLIVMLVVVFSVFVMAGVVVAARRRSGDMRKGAPRQPHRERDEGHTAATAAVSRPAASEDETPHGGATPSWRGRIARTRNVLARSLADAFGRGIDDAAWEGLEEALIVADVGVAAATDIVDTVRRRSRETGAKSAEDVTELLATTLREFLETSDRGLVTTQRPAVWLVTGVNGTGKTTTIGKLAAREIAAGRTVVLAAADTFRAAAGEQLAVWAERTGATLVRKDEGADPASVAYEAHDVARSAGADLLIVDTAGRLHNKRALMDELGKVKRVLVKQAGMVDETLLVLDATTGQNGIAQARAFLEAVDVSGVALTKLDGSSKGGIVIAIQRELGIPVKLAGLGEGIDDLADFDPTAFVDALLARDD